MHRRSFLKTSLAALAAVVLGPLERLMPKAPKELLVVCHYQNFGHRLTVRPAGSWIGDFRLIECEIYDHAGNLVGRETLNNCGHLTVA